MNGSVLIGLSLRRKSGAAVELRFVFVPMGRRGLDGEKGPTKMTFVPLLIRCRYGT